MNSSVDSARDTHEGLRALGVFRLIIGYLKLALGSAVATVLGLAVGMLIPGDGNPGHLLHIALCGVCGWLFWIRRGRSVLATIGICILLIVFSWPIGLALRDSTELLMPWW
jgi:hypothetical protein